MLFTTQKSQARRAAIREGRPDTTQAWFNAMRASGAVTSAGIALVFCGLAFSILLLREDVVSWRPGQRVPHDLIARVDFSYHDKDLLKQKQLEARDNAARVFQATDDNWQTLAGVLQSLPEQAAAAASVDQLPANLRDIIDSGTLSALQQYTGKTLRARYDEAVAAYLAQLRQSDWLLLPAEQRLRDVQLHRAVSLMPGGRLVQADATYPLPISDDLRAKIARLCGDHFRLELQPKMVALTLALARPTHVLDDDATIAARNNAADNVPASEGDVRYRKNAPIVRKGLIDVRDWQLLRAENQAYAASLGSVGWRLKAGLALLAVLLTLALSGYVAHYQPRVVRNHARAIAIAVLLLSMLLLAQLSGIGSGPIYLFGVAPTLLVAMILTIAYEARFAVGMASVHALLVTVALDQRVGFLLILWVGIVVASFTLTDIRTRSKLIEVGGLSACAMMAATAAWGMVQLDPWTYLFTNCLYAGAAGLSVGFVVLGVLPFVEKAFRITTGMTLLELADASHPLLRRLSMEAPGTYNHSLQVATLSEAAGEAIGADPLLCRVASYYHDVGKINKPDYFIENQQPGSTSRHLNLSPSVSLLIIIGHVKDGIEMAREYNLPTSLMPFIQQHHGTTLVEYFYHAAVTQHERRGEDEADVAETQYRYPGPKPRSREVGIVMIADCVESAARAMSEPTANRMEDLVHELILKRLHDGQFDECDLTMRDLLGIERSMVRTLLSIYHGRIPYPSTAPVPVPMIGASRTA